MCLGGDSRAAWLDPTLTTTIAGVRASPYPTEVSRPVQSRVTAALALCVLRSEVEMCEGVEQHGQWVPWGPIRPGEAARGGSQGRRPTCLQDSQHLGGEEVALWEGTSEGIGQWISLAPCLLPRPCLPLIPLGPPGL